MFKLWATIRKDFLILTRDKVGLTLMFLMPVLLAILITAVQNSTFELVNDSKVPLLLSNKDTGNASRQLIASLEKMGRFDLQEIPPGGSPEQLMDSMKKKDALVALVIPSDFSEKIDNKSRHIADMALTDFGLDEDTSVIRDNTLQPLTFYYHPVLQETFRASINGALRSALQMVESRQIVKTLYQSLNEKEIPASIEDGIINNQVLINEIPVSRDGSRNVPNATQHNIPAWTVFAMFFIVISLGSSVVREKLSGSFVRLKTLPTNYLVALFSKQLTYLMVTLAQAAVIFLIGIYLFPLIGLPQLNLPSDLGGLLLVSFICGWCAVSFAICIGVFAQTQEQANGIGAVTIVILAAIGGILVPSFAMPESFNFVMKLSPLHWCLEAYYGLFLEGGKLKDIMMNIIPLLIMIIFIQFITFWGLKSKNLV